MKLYYELGTANVIVVLIKLILETDDQSALSSCQRVRSTGSNVVNASEECIRIRNRLEDAGACERTICQVEFGGKQVTCETANRILVLRAAAVHAFEDLGSLEYAVHLVCAQSLRQVLDRPRAV